MRLASRLRHSLLPLLRACRSKHIVLFDTLISQCKEEEVVAVLAHELGGCGHTCWLHVLCVPRPLPLTRMRARGTECLLEQLRTPHPQACSPPWPLPAQATGSWATRPARSWQARPSC